MNKTYIVSLSKEERDELEALIKKGKNGAHKIKHAHILLHADANGPKERDETIARFFRCHTNTVANVRERFVREGLESALVARKSPERLNKRILDGEKEAKLIALGCSKSPAGTARWTLRLLAERLVELKIVEHISHETVRQKLKKTNLSRT